MALLSLRLVGSLIQIERWRRRHTRPADDGLAQQVRTLANRLGISLPITVLVSDSVSVPGAWGVIRPVLAIPLSLLTGLPPAQVEAILLHELAHIRRFDYLVNFLQTLVETILFYHPATWWISSLVRREREHCCDDIVVVALGDPLPYARALLQLEKRRQALPQPALSARGGKLMNRVQRILVRPAAPSRLLPTASALATLGIVGALLGGALQAQAGDGTSSARGASLAKSSPMQNKLPSVKRTVAKTTTTNAAPQKAVKTTKAAPPLVKTPKALIARLPANAPPAKATGGATSKVTGVKVAEEG